MSMAPGFIETTGMRLREGRDVAATDTASAPPVVLINETMARQYWPDGSAVGAACASGQARPNPGSPSLALLPTSRHQGPTRPVLPTSFGSTLQYSWPRRHFTVRSNVPPATLAPELRAVVRSIDPAVPMGRIQTIDDMVTTQTGPYRLAMLSLTFFGVVATVLCVFGLYAVVALTSQMRRREYVTRMALGAARRDVRWMVIRQALVLGGIGVVLGLFMAATWTRLLEGLLHGVRPLDAMTFAGACTAELVLAAAAASIPARGAGRVDPVEALRF